MVGVISDPAISFPMMQAFMKDLTFRTGLANIRSNIPHLAKLIEHAKIDPRPIISHTLALDETPYGYKIFDARTEGALKVLIKP